MLCKYSYCMFWFDISLQILVSLFASSLSFIVVIHMEPNSSWSINENAFMITIRIGSSGCDGYKGIWVHTHVGGGLSYTNATCPIITPKHDYMGNGWQKHAVWELEPTCKMVEIDIVAFLWMMHNKTIAFVIDSFASNNMVFLMCMLWQMNWAFKW